VRPRQRTEVRRISIAVKAVIEELQKQDYAAADSILREVDRLLDTLAVSELATV
jgi:hypothetical protein